MFATDRLISSLLSLAVKSLLNLRVLEFRPLSDLLFGVLTLLVDVELLHEIDYLICVRLSGGIL